MRSHMDSFGKGPLSLHHCTVELKGVFCFKWWEHFPLTRVGLGQVSLQSLASICELWMNGVRVGSWPWTRVKLTGS